MPHPTDRRRKHPLPPHQRQVIAIAAGVDVRTVNRALAGKPVQPWNLARVRDALERLAAGELRLGVTQ
ncbi:MAG TPA: hypothetical protein VHP33_33610 [Polyangiaceae bacterium]|nr:hypothetical protein [Polyangiaceae bacterium]